jgi:hypothetical protein
MKRFQVFNPEDLDRMSNAFLRASKQLQEAQKNQLAKAIVMTYRPRATEAALAAAALHLVGLNYLN